MSTDIRAVTPLLIVFLDLTRYAAESQRVGDAETADTIDAYYVRLSDAIDAAGGTTVKFIGDAALAVFPENAIDAGVAMLLELKTSVDAFMATRGWACRLTAKAHFGEVVAGQFGPGRDRRFDVLGRAVNTAAMLQSGGVTLSAEAFRKLSPSLRLRFKKHPPPVVYIRGDDPRPARRGGG
jgi:class 3 adenylate cyclase